MAYKIINKISSSKVPAWGNKKKYIAVHYLGVVGQNYDLASDGCGAHYYIYWDGTIYQRCSHDAVPWAVGTGGYYKKVHADAGNYNTISIEMCCKCDGDARYAEDKKWYFTTETQEACVWLVQKLMKDLNIPITNVLRHFDIVNKTCPAPYVHNNKYKTSWTWDEFKAKVAGKPVDASAPAAATSYYRVRKTWADEKSQLGAYTVKQNAIDNCPAGYKVFDGNGKAVYTAKAVSGTQAEDFAGLTEVQAAAKILEMCKKDYEKTGVFASVSAAQMILESGYVKTELATKGNNCFGMKTTLSGNTWPNSTWDGKSKVNIRTAEEYTVGNITYINADFRKYSCLEDSIGDHSAYLLGAMNGSKKRYAGLTDCKNYRDAITLIKKGGYATDSAYVSKICNIIERFGLDKYDKIPTASSPSTSTNTSANNSTSSSTKSTLYRVGTEWKNGKCVNQDGAYASLDNAKKRVDALAKSGKTGYHVFDNKGVSVYPAATAESVFMPYSVRVDTPSLRIRKAPNGAVKKKLGKEMYTGIGVFTIVAEEKAGDYTWGLLKSYEKKRNGWIALEYTKKV